MEKRIYHKLSTVTFERMEIFYAVFNILIPVYILSTYKTPRIFEIPLSHAGFRLHDSQTLIPREKECHG